MTTDFADFLRARRGLVTPRAAGIVAGGRRYVSGLRREELALLAGISVDYYVRLEQGRDRHPSPEVVTALARALRLDDDATAHLHRLASAPAESPGARELRPSVARLVDQSPWPAALLDEALTVVRANAFATRLNPGLTAGRNLVRDAFLDRRAAARHVDPAAVRAECAAALRSVAGARTRRLVGELSRRSEEFRRLWARAEVSYCRTGRKVFDHPAVGALTLDYETLDVAGGLRLLLYSAEPGRPDGDKLALINQV